MTPPLIRSDTISRSAPDFPGLDYAALRSAGIAYVQKHAAANWTDFNEHDPGVTLLELLSYALTDLSYRAGFAIADLLADAHGRIHPTAFALHPAWRALPSPPVTANDFRRMLLDRVAGLGNAWIEPRAAASGVNGLHDIVVQPRVALPGDTLRHAPDERLARRVARAFLRQRPMGEDIGAVTVLRPLPVTIEARIHVVHHVDPEAIVAQAIQRAALALAPEPRRVDLAAMLAESPATLFDGPLPANGFFRDAELGSRSATISLDTIVARIEDIPGVMAVHDARLCAEGTRDADGDLPIPPGLFACLDAELSHHALPLKIVVDGRARPVDHRRVRHLLEDLWREHRRLYPVKAALAEHWPMPDGRPRDLSTFAPLAAALPRVYGLNDGVIPPVTPASRQLLGFLAIFEALMVDFVDRVGAVRGLIATGRWPDTPLASADLLGRVPALRQLGTPPREEAGLPPAMPLDQQERLADFLLVAQGGEVPTVPVSPGIAPDSPAALRHRIAVKHSLLARLPVLARRKGRGFDYRARPAPGKLSGAELLARLLLGDHDVADHRHRVRIGIVEHVLLRPRTSARDAFEDGVHDYGLGVSAVIHLPHGKDGHGAYRRAIEQALRDASPAHLTVAVHPVDIRDWRRFTHAYRHWRAGLRDGDDETIDWTSIELREMLAEFAVEGPQ